MQLSRIHGDLDIGFTDLLVPGGGVAKPGHLAVSMTGSSLIATITAGVVWCPDHAGAFTGIVDSLVRQVYGGGTVTLKPNVDAADFRIDTIVARANNGWGGAPQILVREGKAEFTFANIINGWGMTAFQPGDVPLAVVALPPASANPPGFSGDGSQNDLRKLAADLTPPGIVKEYDGAVPPIGYKWHDGSEYQQILLPALYAALGLTQGAPALAGTFKIGDSRGRATVGADSMGVGGAANRIPNSPRAISQAGGEELHVLSVAEMASHSHAVNDPGHAHTLSVVYSEPGTHIGGAVLVRDNFVAYAFSTLGINTSFTGISLVGAGGDKPHYNMQPYRVAAKVIKF